MIYLNNGASSWPKPPAVLEALQACLSGTPAAQFRGGSSIMKKDVEVLCREKLGESPLDIQTLDRIGVVAAPEFREVFQCLVITAGSTSGTKHDW